jgi:hypothetical protein
MSELGIEARTHPPRTEGGREPEIGLQPQGATRNVG